MARELIGFDGLLADIEFSLLKMSHDRSAVADAYWSIGGRMLDEANKIGLDEDINNLVCFSVGVVEMISPRLRERLRKTGVNHWNHNPLQYKVHGLNSQVSDIRSEEKMKAAMVNVFALQLSGDSEYQSASKALISFQDSNKLWTEDDYLG